MSPPKLTQIGRYKVLRTLGEGGMGAVFLAEDPAIDRLLAIKLMRKGFDDGQMRERFTREARAIGRLRHPNIVMVFDVGEHDGDPFIAMEYVEGETLAGVIRNNPDLPVGRKLEIMDALCAGLYYAHRNGVIHRDIKPPNIMVDTEGGVKILDFGIARGPASGMTQAGTVIGTLNYMAPEQLAGKRVDLRADIWAVGTVFYEVLTGQQAFPGDIQSGVLHQILMGQPTPLTQVIPSLHPDIIGAVERCLKKDPEERYSDLEVMRRALFALKSEAWASEAVESTIRMPSLRPSDRGPLPETPPPRASRTPGEETRNQLLQLRRDRIAQQLNDARAALESRDYTRAMESCQQALIIDPENVEAQELQDRVRNERRAHGLVVDARAELDKNALTAASALIEEALQLAPDMADVQALREDVAEARRRQDAQQTRARAVQEAIARGRKHVADGAFDQAMAAVAEVHRLDPGNAEAARLGRDVEAGRLAKARADEEARAKRAIEDAKQHFAAGRHDRAVALLRDYRPPQPIVMEALQTLERERAEIQRARQRQAEEDARRKAAEEDARRKAEEERRKAEEAKAAAERRKAEEARQREEEQRRVEDKRRADEQRRVEAQQRADEQRRAEEQRRADEKRRADEARQAEEARRAEARRKADEDRARATDVPKTVVLRDPIPLERPTDPAGRTVILPEAQAKGLGDGKTVVIPGGKTVVIPEGKTVVLPEVKLPVPEGKTVLLREPVPPVREPIRPPPVAPLPPEGIAPVQRKLPLPWIGAGAALLVAVLAWALWPSGTPPPPVGPPQAVVIDFRPWANVTIKRKADGQAVGQECTGTPCVVSLPPGEYSVQAAHPDLGEHTFDFAVVAGQPTSVKHALPGLDAEAEARRIIDKR